jgi:glucan phosphoethanolaminetransferase (alkaline phosphatase superfamily)
MTCLGPVVVVGLCGCDSVLAWQRICSSRLHSLPKKWNRSDLPLLLLLLLLLPVLAVMMRDWLMMSSRLHKTLLLLLFIRKERVRASKKK